MPSPRDEDYLDDLLNDSPADEPTALSGTPTDMMRQIAKDPKQPANARVAALRALMDSGAPDSADAAMVQVVKDVHELSGAELDKELAGFMNGGWQPPPPPPPGSEEAIEQEVRRRIRAWSKSQGVRLERPVSAPRPAPPEPERVAATTDSESEAAKVVPLSAVEKRRLVRESNRAAQWAERLPPRPEGVSREVWEMYGDEMDGV